MSHTEKPRCPWCLSSPDMIAYHDTEWGTPLWDDQKLFEFMVLDAFQAGLSWSTIIKKRENFRQAFDNFDPQKIAQYDEKKIQSLLQDAGIIRNQAKVRGTVKNAQAFLRVQRREGNFAQYIWQFVEGKPIHRHLQTPAEYRASSPESDAMSKALKAEGFTFVGTTICYAFMQAAGMMNDHLTTCWRYEQVLNYRT